MKFRFSVRSLLLATALVATTIFLCKEFYEEYLIPRTPLEWKNCTAEKLAAIFEGQRPVLICAQGDTFTLEYLSDSGAARPGFRRFIYNHDVELLLDSSGAWFGYPSPEIYEFIASHKPDEATSTKAPDFILVFPPKKELITIPYHATVYIDGIPDAGKNAAESIIDAVHKHSNRTTRERN